MMGLLSFAAALIFAICRSLLTVWTFAGGVSAASLNELLIYFAGGVLGLVLLGIIISVGIVLAVYLIFSLIFGGKRRRRKREEKEMLEKAAEAERQAKKAVWEERKKRNKEEEKPAEELPLAPELSAKPQTSSAAKPAAAKAQSAADKAQSIAPIITPTWTADQAAHAAKAATLTSAPQAAEARPKSAPVKPPVSQNPDVFYIPLVTEAVPDLPVLDVPSIIEAEIEEKAVAVQPARSTETPAAEKVEEDGGIEDESQPVEQKAEEPEHKKEEEQSALPTNDPMLTGLIPDEVDIDKILNEPIAELADEENKESLLSPSTDTLSDQAGKENELDADTMPAEATEENAKNENTEDAGAENVSEEAVPLPQPDNQNLTAEEAVSEPERSALPDLAKGEIAAGQAEVAEAATDLAETTAPVVVKEKAKKPAAPKPKTEGQNAVTAEKNPPAKAKTAQTTAEKKAPAKAKTADTKPKTTTAPKTKAVKPKEAAPAAATKAEEAVSPPPAAPIPQPEKPAPTAEPKQDKAVSEPDAEPKKASLKERIEDEIYVSEMNKLPKSKPQNKVTSIEEALAMLAGTPPSEKKK